MIMVCVQCTAVLYTFTKWSSNCHIVKLFSFPQLPLPTQGSAIYFQHFHLLPYIFGIFICCHIFPWISTPQAITYQPQRGNPKKLGLGEKLEGWTSTVHRKKWRPSIDSWRFLYFFSQESSLRWFLKITSECQMNFLDFQAVNMSSWYLPSARHSANLLSMVDLSGLTIVVKLKRN